MSAPYFAVETVGTIICVIVENQGRFVPLFKALNESGAEATCLDVRQSNSSLPPQSELNVVFLTPSLARFFIEEGRELWDSLRRNPSQRLVIIEKSWQKTPLALPDNCLHLLLGEYLGLDGEGSPTLDNLVSSITTMHHVPLGSGGISEYSLMSEEYLVLALSQILTNLPSAPALDLASPHPISMLSLCQKLIEISPVSFDISYEDGGLTPNHSIARTSETLQQILKDISCVPTGSLVSTFLQSLPTASSPPTPRPIDTPHLPPLKTAKESEPPTPLPPSTPRNLLNLEFVPLQTPKRRLAAKTKLKLRGLRVISRGLALGVILYIGSLMLALGITVVTIQNYKSKIIARDFTQLPLNAATKLAGKYLYSNAVAWGWEDATLLTDAYNQALRLSETLSSLAASSESIATYILTGTGDNLAAKLSSARLATEELYQQTSLLDGMLPAATPTLISRYDQAYQSLKAQFPTAKKHLLLGKGVFSVLPEVIGLGTRAKYAVLFQNNMELRGTGGFIGSFAVLSFENGKLYDLMIYDVYSSDGQLKGHVEPPVPIKNILGEAKWYLRDSNFDPDFPTSARRAEWFLKKSMNLDVAGTAAINLETLKGLLNAVGPLPLPDYNETVSADNLTERAQYHAEVNFFPGSTAKKEFLSSVADALFAKLKEGDSGMLLNSILALTTSLEQSDLQLSSLNPTTERVLQTLGWNGQIENKPCPSSPCYDDYFFSVDSNFGVNKANFYISKSTKLAITIDKDGIPNNTLTTVWNNKATSNAWPAGPYKNYTRVYLPGNVSIKSVKIGDRVLTSDEYTITVEHGKTVVAYLLTVPTSTTITSSLEYINSTPIKSGILYSLYYQKQSGVSPQDPVSVIINYPLYLKPTQISPAATMSPQQLNFDFVSDTDHRVSIQF